MAKDKKGFILYADQKALFDQLPDEKAGELIKFIFSYVNDENPITEDLIIKLAFTPIQQQLKRDLKKYEETKEKRSEAGKAGANKRWQNIANDSKRISSITKIADNVNDNVNVKDKDINILVPFQERVSKFLLWFNTEFIKHGKHEAKFKVLNNQTEKNLKKLLDKYSAEEWNTAFENMINNSWVIETKNATPDHFLRLANFEKYLNQGKQQKNNFKFAHS